MISIYSLHVDFGKKLTGVERSALKRAHLFNNQLNLPVIFITCKLNIDLSENVENLRKIEWMPLNSKVINVYDDLRESSGVYNANNEIFKEIDKDNFKVSLINDKHERWYSIDDKFNMYVVWSDIDKSKISYINIFYKNKKIRRHKYDKNGKLYVIQYLNEKGVVYQDELISLSNNVFLKRYYDVDLNDIYRIEMVGSNNIVSIFSNEKELNEWWLKSKEFPDKSVFLIDKNRFWNQAVNDFKYKTISVLHSVHFQENSILDINGGKLNSNYKEILEGVYKVDKVLTLTEQQRDDLIFRFNNPDFYETIPHSLDFQPDFNPLYKNKSGYFNIVALCRLSPEKQIEDMIYMMQELVKINNKVKLFVYGDGGQRSYLEKLVCDLNLEKHVFFPGYVQNLKEVYSDAFLSILTSKCEGFSLSVLESLSYSVPVVSYNVKYGPSSMIEDGFNGYLFEQKKFKDMAVKVNSILKNSDLYNNMRKNAYEISLNYSEAKVADRWRKLINQLLS